MFFDVVRGFSPEGFCSLSVVDVLKEIGYSGAEAGRLLRSGAVQIRDTRVTPDGNHWEWYRRKARETELIEPEDILSVSNSRFITIKKKPYPFYKALFYWLRPYWEKYIFEAGR